MENREELRKKLDLVLMEYVKEFEKKHDLTFEFAVKDDLMDVICFGCIFYFSIDDIIKDIDGGYNKGVIIDWLYYCIDLEDGKRINFESYAKGARL